MSKIKSSIQEAAGFIEEEAGELLHNKKMARKGRAERNVGRVSQGKMPKLSEPGTGN